MVHCLDKFIVTLKMKTVQIFPVSLFKTFWYSLLQSRKIINKSKQTGRRNDSRLIMRDTKNPEAYFTFNLCVRQKTLFFFFKHLSKQIAKVIKQRILYCLTSCWVCFHPLTSSTKLHSLRWFFFTKFETRWAKMAFCHEKVAAVSFRTKHFHWFLTWLDFNAFFE